MCMLSRVWLFSTPWTVALQAPLVHGIFQARTQEWVDCHFLLWRIFLTQGSNPCLPIGRWILYHCATWETPILSLFFFKNLKKQAHICCLKAESVSRSVVSNSLSQYGLYNPPSSSVHGILQVRILEWVAILFSRASSRPRDWIWVSSTAGKFFTVWAIREAHMLCVRYQILFYSQQSH